MSEDVQVKGMKGVVQIEVTEEMVKKVIPQLIQYSKIKEINLTPALFGRILEEITKIVAEGMEDLVFSGLDSAYDPSAEYLTINYARAMDFCSWYEKKLWRDNGYHADLGAHVSVSVDGERKGQLRIDIWHGGTENEDVHSVAVLDAKELDNEKLSYQELLFKLVWL